MRRHRDELIDDIVLIQRHTLDAAAATVLYLVGIGRNPLDIAVLRKRNNDILNRNQILIIHVADRIKNLCLARIIVFIADHAQLILENLIDPCLMGQNILQIRNFDQKILIFRLDLFTLQTGQAAELHIQNGLRLNLIQTEAAHQTRHSLIGILRITDRMNDRIQIVDRNPQTFQNMGTVLCLLQIKGRTSADDFLLEADVFRQNILQAALLRGTVYEHNVIDRKRSLQRRQTIQLIQKNFRLHILAQFHDDTDTVHVRFVAQIRNSFNHLVTGKIRNPRYHCGLVYLIGDFIDNDALLAVRHTFNMRPGTHDNGTSAGLKGSPDAAAAKNKAAGRKVRSLDILHQLRHGNIRIRHYLQNGINDFAEIVRRNIGRHTDGNTLTAIDQQVREAGRKNRRLLFFAIVVVLHVDGILVQISEHLDSDLGHTCFRITHRGCTVSVHVTEVAMAIDQYLAHVPVLGHVNKGAIDGTVTVRVIFSHCVADNTCTLLIRLVRTVIHLVHGEENTALYRLQTVTNIRQSTRNNDRHRIIKEVTADFLGQLGFRNISRIEL